MRTAMFVAASVGALLLAACGQKTETATKEAAGDANAAVNAVQDAAAAPVGQASASMMGSHDTGAFVSNAAMSDMYEVAAGELAAGSAKSPDVKAFGKMMSRDHAKSTGELKPLAAAAGQTPPDALDQRRQGLLDNLRDAAKAGNFDKTYLDQQVAAHEEALTLLKGYAEDGDHAGLKAFAAKTAPTVQHHLDRAKALQAAIK